MHGLFWTNWTRLGLPSKPIQHHLAHVVACMAENEIEPPALGVAWDGTGYGLDGTIWGSEFLLVKGDGSFERVAHFRQFRLPGGDRQSRSRVVAPWGCFTRSSATAHGISHRWWTICCEQEKSLLRRILEKKVNTRLLRDVGRLFDAVAALLGLRQTSSFEGRAAMELESHGRAMSRMRIHL